MAYYDQRTGTNQRAVTATIVAALQGAAIIALVHGLAVTFIPPKEVPNPQAPLVPLTPITPDEPIARPPDKPVTNGKSPTDATNSKLSADDGDNKVIVVPPVGQPTDAGTVTRDPPPPPPASFAQGARPASNPGGWVTQNDYSPGDIRAERQGSATFRVSIGTDGKVKSCTILDSTGFASLDAATCKHVTRRARFQPALDDTGNPVTGSYTGSIRWVIPE